MAAYIHCNKCYTRPQQDLQFSLTNCRHIICGQCVENAQTNGRCLVCNKEAKYIVIGKEMEPRLVEFFKPPKDFFIKKMEALKQNYDIEENCYKSLIRHFAGMNNQFGGAMQQYNGQKAALQADQIQIAKLKKKLHSSEDKIKTLEKSVESLSKQISNVRLKKRVRDQHGGTIKKVKPKTGAKAIEKFIHQPKSEIVPSDKGLDFLFEPVQVTSPEKSESSVSSLNVTHSSNNSFAQKSLIMTTPKMLGMRDRSPAVTSSKTPPTSGNPYMKAMLNRVSGRYGGMSKRLSPSEQGNYFKGPSPLPGLNNHCSAPGAISLSTPTVRLQSQNDRHGITPRATLPSKRPEPSPAAKIFVADDSSIFSGTSRTSPSSTETPCNTSWAADTKPCLDKPKVEQTSFKDVKKTPNFRPLFTELLKSVTGNDVPTPTSAKATKGGHYITPGRILPLSSTPSGSRL